MTEYQPYPPPGLPAGPPLAGYGPRLGGWLIDFVVVSIVWLIVALPLHLLHQVAVHLRGVDTYRYHVGPAGIFVDAVIVIVYGGLFTGLPRGQTVGMMAAGTRVVRGASGEPIGYPRAFGRAGFEFLMSVALFIPFIIDMLFPLWDPQNQTLHDKVVDTVVVSV
jgi:uncharacterized RDD family membrane protein YckC